MCRLPFCFSPPELKAPSRRDHVRDGKERETKPSSSLPDHLFARNLHCPRPMSPARPVRRRQPANAGARIKISRNALLDVRSCSSSMQADLCQFLALLLRLLLLLLSARCHRCQPHRPTQTCQPPKPSLPRRPASILLSLGIQAPSWSRKMATFDSWIATFGLVSTTRLVEAMGWAMADLNHDLNSKLGSWRP